MKLFYRFLCVYCYCYIVTVCEVVTTTTCTHFLKLLWSLTSCKQEISSHIINEAILSLPCRYSTILNGSPAPSHCSSSGEYEPHQSTTTTTPGELLRPSASANRILSPTNFYSQNPFSYSRQSSVGSGTGAALAMEPSFSCSSARNSPYPDSTLSTPASRIPASYQDPHFYCKSSSSAGRAPSFFRDPASNGPASMSSSSRISSFYPSNSSSFASGPNGNSSTALDGYLTFRRNPRRASQEFYWCRRCLRKDKKLFWKVKKKNPSSIITYREFFFPLCDCHVISSRLMKRDLKHKAVNMCPKNWLFSFAL